MATGRALSSSGGTAVQSPGSRGGSSGPAGPHAGLSYALASLGCGVRQVLREELRETPRAELVAALGRSFQADELKGALEEAFERGVQSLVVGLKQAWLLMETGGERDYCEAFGEKVRTPFAEEEGVEGRLFIDFLDGFFLDYGTAIDAAAQVLGLPGLEPHTLFELVLGAGQGDVEALAGQATRALQQGFVAGAGLEEEHPIVRLGSWRNLLAEAVHYQFTDIVAGHPSWSRYLDPLAAETLDREEGRAIAARDQESKARLAEIRALCQRRVAHEEQLGDILPNREWLFDLADRLEDLAENAESDLLKGKTLAASDLPKIVAAAVSKVHSRMGTSPVGSLADALLQPPPALVDVVRRARRDFRRCHWGGADYGEAALMLAGALLPLAGPRAAERYYREALAFGADKATAEYGLYLVDLLTGAWRSALQHLLQAAQHSPERFALFDFARYRPLQILGAGGGGPVFKVQVEGSEEELVVKALWDPVSVVDPRPCLLPLKTMAELQGQGQLLGFPRVAHLGVHLRERPYVVTSFVEGDDLEGYREARGGEAPSSAVAMIGAEVARRLAELHGRGIVHRNIKPGNVRVGAGEEGLSITLLDASLPNLLLVTPDRVQGVRRLLAWSRVGRVIAEGFANYTAPEVIRGGINAATPLSDVYSLGAVLYRLATGAPPRNPSAEALPPSLRDLVMRCLAREAGERPASADELVGALTAVAEAPEEAPTVPMGTSMSALDDGLGDPFGAFPGSGAPAGAVAARDAFAPVDSFAPAVDPFDASQAPGAPFPTPTAADPFAAPAADPFAASQDPFAAADPFAPPAPGADPFVPAGFTDPFAAQSAPAVDPFAASQDPFAAPGLAADPFAPPPFAAPDPFAAAQDPFAAPAPDPFAAAPDPFAAPAQGDPFAAAQDPFAAGDPFAAAQDPFANVEADPTAVEDEEMPLDPSEALAMLENLLGQSPKRPKPAARPAPRAAKPAAPGRRPPPAAPPAAPPPNDPFAAAAFGAPDPFAAAAPDPFAAGDPFAAAQSDPFAAAAPDPFAAAQHDPAQHDPFAAQNDPFAAAAQNDPFAAAAQHDPFAAQNDPFAAAAQHDPFAAAAQNDPFAAGSPPAGNDPFASFGGPPPAAPSRARAGGADPFADLDGPGAWGAPQGAAPDPFAEAEAAAPDPFAAAAQNDPFAAAAQNDPFAAAAQNDPFAAAAQHDPFAAAAQNDPFAAAAQHDPFAAAAQNDPFAAAAAQDPWAQAQVDPFALGFSQEAEQAGVSPGGMWLSEETEKQAPPPAAPAPAAPKKKKAAKQDAEYGLMISGHGTKQATLDAAVKLVMKICKVSESEARDKCRASVVPVIKGCTSKEEVDAAAAQFQAIKVNARVTTKKRGGR